MPGGGVRLGLGEHVGILLVGWLLGADPLTLLQVLAGGLEAVQVPEPFPGGAAGERRPPDEACDTFATAGS